MRSTVGSSTRQAGAVRQARTPRRLTAGEGRTGDGEDVVDLDPARPREAVAIGQLVTEHVLAPVAAAALARMGVGVLGTNSETAGADPHMPFGGVEQRAYGPQGQGRAACGFLTRTRAVYLRGSARSAR
ncbi:hypothetical protein [Streptomyces europaeiscabiei]|uniref:hypothetical protein n=1 Tax=Streptomyces europaeiscabiei TaxID=146819 RepID=UPI0029B6D74E|nr:hypothetical protein [Streptomyces europaeiscabiei]MDX2757220.1 hypothetical protein [Streptomyces europaeiscabiei]